MRALQFTKMQGLGNDFVVLEGPIELSTADIAEICDRRFGIGADGVLVVSNGDPIRMDYWNADGTTAEMCGNGLRCVARYAYDKGWASDRDFAIQTAVGMRTVRVGDDDVTVDLGRLTITGHTEIDGLRFHLIDAGNPHAVAIVEDPDEIDVATVGPRVETDAQFAQGTNVELISVTDGQVTMRVWERGVGETLACGTGMVAAAFVATKTHHLDGTIPVTVRGGQGRVELRDGIAWLSGPARYSFRGSVGER